MLGWFWSAWVWCHELDRGRGLMIHVRKSGEDGVVRAVMRWWMKMDGCIDMLNKVDWGSYNGLVYLTSMPILLPIWVTILGHYSTTLEQVEERNRRGRARDGGTSWELGYNSFDSPWCFCAEGREYTWFCSGWSLNIDHWRSISKKWGVWDLPPLLLFIYGHLDTRQIILDICSLQWWRKERMVTRELRN
jgi:hypothetical protein